MDYKLAAPYYRMAGLTPMEVVNRVKKIELPPEVAAERKNMVCSTRAVCVWSYIVHSDLETTLI
jgi:hypothetical protein